VTVGVEEEFVLVDPGSGAEAAKHTGCVAPATGVALFGAASRVTADLRHRTLAARFPALVGEAGTCACHVRAGGCWVLGAAVVAFAVVEADKVLWHRFTSARAGGEGRRR